MPFDSIRGSRLFGRRARARQAADSEFLDRVYRDLLGRPVDEAAREHFVALLAHGHGRDEVLFAVAGSEEFAERSMRKSPPNAAFLDGVYQRLLGRPLDRSGLEHCEKLLDAGADRIDVVLSIVQSEEYEHHVVRKHVVLPDLTELRPDRFRHEPKTGSESHDELVPVFVAEEPEDFDWLEDAILSSGYYERPGIWTLGVDEDKRLMGQVLGSLGAERALDLGCASGAVMECLAEHGVYAEGLEISRAAIRRAKPEMAARIHCADVLDADLPTYDLVYGLDIFEHFNPNRLDAYLKRIAELIPDGGLLFANIPAYGHDAVFGTVFEMFLDEWHSAAVEDRNFRHLHVDDDGYPMHGHLIWAATGWWQRQFEQVGLRRVVQLEEQIHARYDEALAQVSPARRSFFVFKRDAA